MRHAFSQETSAEPSAEEAEKQLDLDDFLTLRTDISKLRMKAAASITCGRATRVLESVASSPRLRQIALNRGEVRIPIEQYFMEIALICKLNSNCRKQKVGCVIFTEKTLLSVGWNGSVEQDGQAACNRGGCFRCLKGDGQGRNLENCICMHAEVRAIMNLGIKNTSRATLLCTLFPCMNCAVLIVQAVF